MKKEMTSLRAVALLLIAVGMLSALGVAAYAQVGGGFDLSWNTVDAGGGTFSTGGAYNVGGTIGQPDAGSQAGGQYALLGGFWGVAVDPQGGGTATVTPTPGGSTPTSTPTCGSAGTPGPWSTASPVATSVTGPAMSSDGTYGYLVSGVSLSPVPTWTDQFARYDPTTDTWTSLAAVPTPAQGSSAVYAPNTGKLYDFGGSGPGAVLVSTTRIYDIAAGTWSLGAPMPGPRIFSAIGYYNGKIYLVGGRSTGADGSEEQQVWEYDPVADSWDTSRTNMPQRRAAYGYGVINGHIYVAGGTDTTGTIVPDVFDYDISANTWNTRTAMPVPLAVPGSAVVGDKLWIIGGENSSLVGVNSTYIYDPSLDTWSQGPNLNVARYNLGAARVGNYVVATGGQSSSPSLNTNEVSLTPFTQCASATPTTTPTLAPTLAPTQTPGGPSATPQPTFTPGGPTSTANATSIATATSASTSVATPTSCTVQFSDVPPDSPFYAYIRCLACRDVISGYDDGTFRPYTQITRGQISKMVSNAAGFFEDPGPQIYDDVPPSYTFYQYINRLTVRGIMGGYPCPLTADGSCVPGDTRYFRPELNATRGQMSKIVSNAAGFDDDPGGQFYTDVPPDNTFYVWVMRLTERGVMSGYECGGVNPQTGDPEPCDDQNRPYFRPFNEVTRGQASKLVSNTFFPNCQAPARK